MTPKVVEQVLLVLERQMRRLLDDLAPGVLAQARAEVATTYEKYLDGLRRNPVVDRPWGFSISPEFPLTFHPQPVDGIDVQFDISADFRWRRPQDPPCHQELLIRLWCSDLNVAYRDEMDAEAVVGAIADIKGRVMHRMHFDLANPGQAGPRYHLQVGGNARQNELAWFHPSIAIPRLAIAPMDLCLAAEMIVANTTDPIDPCLEEPTLEWAVAECQAELHTSYFRESLAAVEARKSVLRTTWNVTP